MAINRRLIFWLIKAYIKRWKKTIFLCFILGLLAFFLLKTFLPTILAKFPLVQKEYIGTVGVYTPENLPPLITRELSHGLTQLSNSGVPKPDLATSWEIKDGGKTYVMHLKSNQHFSDGSLFTSKNIRYSFSDVKIKQQNDTTVVFQLKEPYAPFLTRLSQPIFKDGLVGVNGAYQVKDIVLNGSFVTSMTLVNIQQPFVVKVYTFYPTQEALRLAFVQGNITKAVGLASLEFQNTSLSTFPNITITRSVNYDQLVTLFYNTQDRYLSDKRLRDGLSYLLPNSFSQGERALSPIPPHSWAYQADFLRTQDREHAQILLNAVTDNGKSPLPKLTIITLPKYRRVAEEVQKAWEAGGIETTIQTSTTVPTVFSIFLGSFNLPDDPDQYSLWHSDQQNNLSRYKSLRIDKLLEDGRQISDQNQRLKVYADFQKYLMDDQPASFLYFPYAYTVSKR